MTTLFLEADDRYRDKTLFVTGRRFTDHVLDLRELKSFDQLLRELELFCDNNKEKEVDSLVIHLDALLEGLLEDAKWSDDEKMNSHKILNDRVSQISDLVTRYQVKFNYLGLVDFSPDYTVKKLSSRQNSVAYSALIKSVKNFESIGAKKVVKHISTPDESPEGYTQIGYGAPTPTSFSSLKEKFKQYCEAYSGRVVERLIFGGNDCHGGGHKVTGNLSDEQLQELIDIANHYNVKFKYIGLESCHGIRAAKQISEILTEPGIITGHYGKTIGGYSDGAIINENFIATLQKKFREDPHGFFIEKKAGGLKCHQLNLEEIIMSSFRKNLFDSAGNLKNLDSQKDYDEILVVVHKILNPETRKQSKADFSSKYRVLLRKAGHDLRIFADTVNNLLGLIDEVDLFEPSERHVGDSFSSTLARKLQVIFGDVLDAEIGEHDEHATQEQGQVIGLASGTQQPFTPLRALKDKDGDSSAVHDPKNSSSLTQKPTVMVTHGSSQHDGAAVLAAGA